MCVHFVTYPFFEGKYIPKAPYLLFVLFVLFALLDLLDLFALFVLLDPPICPIAPTSPTPTLSHLGQRDTSGGGAYPPDSSTYTYYLGGKSIHVCTHQCTHVYTTVYTRVHYLALSISSEGLSSGYIPRC